MKAWYLSDKDGDNGTFLVFADTRNQARAQADSNDMMYDTWLDIRAVRAKKFDDLEKLPQIELDLLLWRRDGWHWLDMDTPDPYETTDEQFKEWYKVNISHG